MSAYLQSYGAGEEERNRRIKWLVLGLIGVVIVGIAAYFYFQDFTEERLTTQFLKDLNAQQFEDAYHVWGCSDAKPCRDYSYQKFLEDWGPDKGKGDWKIKGVDGCPTGVIVAVAATGTERTSLWVERDGGSLSFSPWDECQGKKWRFKQFFRRLFGG
jgi:hypothetical protein